MGALVVAMSVVIVVAVAAAVVADRRARAGAPRQQVLLLDDTQLVSYALEDGELVLDFFGGDGRWACYARGALVSSGRVDDTPTLTVRAATDDILDIALFEKLGRWVEVSEPLQVKLEGAGGTPLEHPTRLQLSDGYRSVSVVEPQHS